MLNFEDQYLYILDKLIKEGILSDNRTGIKTLALFNEQMNIHLKEGFPILTTKKVFFRGVVEEMLFFLRGDTNTKVLEEKGINYWKGNTSREFLDSRGLDYLPEGEMGCGYGHQFRNFGGEHLLIKETSGLKGVDQVKEVIETLKKDKTSRRCIISLWNPNQLNFSALPPCHLYTQFVVNQKLNELNCFFLMRSNDFFLGNPTNMIQYALLTHLIATVCGLKPGRLVFTGVDVHLYENHIPAAAEQLNREPSSLPKLIIPEVTSLEDICRLTEKDIYLEGYNPLPAIKAPMAI